MLRSSNPILSKEDAFTPAAPQQNPYGQQQYSQYNPYGQPSNVQDPYAQPQGYGQPPTPTATGGRMTMDDVVTKTAITIGTVVIFAALAWMLVPPALYLPGLILSGIVGFVAVLLVSFRRTVSPPLVLAYAAIEGVFIGLISNLYNARFEGIVVQAVIGTFVAAGVTLAAYKFFNIRVTPKFQKIVFLATISFAALMLGNLVFSLFSGGGLGLRGGLLGIGVSAVAIVLAVLNLVLDFDYIERGIKSGAPDSESWRGAFGLTVTMVWLYIELLHLLSLLRGNS
jgi:uncharacterized YccA/Bax inhibitor family protein